MNELLFSRVHHIIMVKRKMSTILVAIYRHSIFNIPYCSEHVLEDIMEWFSSGILF